MNATLLFGLCGCALAAIGLYGLIARAHLLRQLLGFNMVGSGVFLVFGSVAARGGAGVDPVPQAMIITGIVVALAGTALGLALVGRLHDAAAPPEGGESRGQDDGH